MIFLTVDESYAFDYLSILEIKCKKDKNSRTKKQLYNQCFISIKKQLSDTLFKSIISSKEYKECCKANFDTFIAVDSAKTDKVKASFVDRCNYKRFTAKQKLQKKFFGNSITEIKIGYEHYKE